MTYKPSNMSSKSTVFNLRDLALTVAKAHDLPLAVVVEADEVSENDEGFLTAICASADLQEIVCGSGR